MKTTLARAAAALPLLALLACAAPPAAPPAAPAAVVAGTAGPYLPPGEPDLVRYLAPPPAPGSAADARDLAAVLAAQAARTPAEVEAARLDQSVEVARFADVLGPRFSAKRLPRTFELARRACREASAVVRAAKDHWDRPRPYRASAAVEPVIANTTHGAYPSGHAACGFLWAIVLADLVPGRRAALFDRGTAYGWNRVVGGVHYPTDVEAGRAAAAVVAAVMFASPSFRADLEAARAEIAAAGLPGAGLSSAP